MVSLQDLLPKRGQRQFDRQLGGLVTFVEYGIDFYDFETQHATVVGDGLALLHANWTYYRGQDSIPGLSTEVVRRQPDGSWLFVIDEPRTPEYKNS